MKRKCKDLNKLSKEIYYGNKAKGNHWCWYDILADLLGIIAGGLIIWMIS